MKLQKAKFLSPFIVLVFFQCMNLQAQNDDQINANKLLKDFDDLIEVIDAHPDPYTHISEEDFNAHVEEVKVSLGRPHSTLEFYRKAAATIALIKDGHSNVYLPQFWLQKQRKDNGAFPYDVHLTNADELYIIKNFGEEGIPIGAKILSINGITVDSFLNRIDPYISYEIKSFRNTVIDEDFEKYLYLAYGHSDSTKIEYLSVDTTLVEVENMPYRDWRSTQKDNREEREASIAKGEPYTYEKITDGVGLIHIYSFSVPDVSLYNIFLRKTFREIRNDSIHSLVIDIRGNFGGSSEIASLLFHYISDAYFKTMAESSMKVSYPYRNMFLDAAPGLRYNKHEYLFFTGRHELDIDAILNDPIGSYVYESAVFNEEPITEKFEFTGDCYLLTNRDSYSAASSFAATFQCYQMGVTVGEETGGTKIFRANAMYEKLSRTNLGVGMSTTKLYTTCFDQEMEGVKPTVEYTSSIFEIVSEMDTQLLYTQRLIRKMQQAKAEAATTEEE